MSENAPILFYDGQCNLCHFAVRYVVKWDKHKTIFFAPLQGETAARLLPILVQKEDSVVFMEGAEIYIKSKAAFRVAKRMGFPVSLWSVFGFLPLFVSDRIYDAIAKRRYRWWGRRSSCEIPQAKDQSRFLP